MGSTLLSHTGETELVSYEQLKNYSAPDPTRTWRPISHTELVDTMRESLSEFGFGLQREQFAVARDGKRLFATFDLDGIIGDGRQGLSIGLRHGNDKSLSVQTVGGARVFVCDNMMFSGDMISLRHKHSTNWTLRDSLGEAMQGFSNRAVDMGERIGRLQARTLSDDQAKGLLVDAIIKGACPVRLFRPVYDNYFMVDEVNRPDCAPRSAWGLHNSFTRALHGVRPSSEFESSVRLGSMFGI